MTFDPVQNPSHYTAGREFETIDVIEDWGLGFHLGNAVKYISRAGRKDPDKLGQDISKAIWYLERYQDMCTEQKRKRVQTDLEQFASEGTYSILTTPGGLRSPQSRRADVVEDAQEEVEFHALGDLPSSILFGVDDPIYAAQEVPFTYEFDDTISFEPSTFTASSYGKDLSKFEGDDVIVSTFIEGEFMIGKQKNGAVRIIGRADGKDLYEEVLKADPQDLAPSEFEPMHDA